MRPGITCALLVVALPARAGDVAALVAEAKPAVVALTVLDAGGKPIGNATGFFVDRRGTLITNQHVTKVARAMRATLADGRVFEVEGLLAEDAARDLAVLQVAVDEVAALRLGEAAGLGEGEPVVVIGSPLGLSWTVSEGIVSAKREEGVPQALKATREERGALLQITAPISPGSSGSPVLTLDGQVVGVARSGIAGGGNLNFATPAEAVRELLRAIPADATPASLAPARLRNLAVSLGVFAAVGLAYALATRQRRPRAAPRPPTAVN